MLNPVTIYYYKAVYVDFIVPINTASACFIHFIFNINPLKHSTAIEITHKFIANHDI